MIEAWDDPVASNDRVLFAVFIALVVHAALILGISFTREDPQPAAESLEVTLAQYRSEDAVANPDFIAQANQAGSGDRERKSELQSPEPSPFNAAQVQQAAALPATPPPLAPAEARPLSATTSSVRVADAAANESAALAPVLPEANGERAQVAAEIASLAALLDSRQRAYAKLPRVQRLTSVSARAADDAAYLFAWKQRIERVGNRNYPEEARRLRLFGDLRLLVSLRADGSVLQMRVLKSSGYPVLDRAALRIVRMAAPFDAFPAAMRERADVLEIIRTWQFRSDRLTSTE